MSHIGKSGVGCFGSGLVLGLIFRNGALRALRSVLHGFGIVDNRYSTIIIRNASAGIKLSHIPGIIQ